MSNYCKDCRFYLAIDVFKGICKKDKKNILTDNADEKCFEKNKKCKYCANFTVSDKENIGSCMGKIIAYPDMTAVTCEYFKWK